MLSGIWVAAKVSMLLWAASYLFCMLLRPADALWVKTKLMPVAIGLFPLGMLAPNVWFFWAGLFLIPATFSRTRIEATCLYVTTVFFAPTVGRQLGIGSIYLLALDKWLFCALGLTAATFFKPIRGRTPRGWYDVPFWLLIGCSILLQRGTNFTSILRGELDIMLGFIMPYYCFTRSLRSPEDMRRFMLTVAFVTVVLSIVGFYEWRTSFLPYEAIQNHLGTSLAINPYSKQRSGGLRASTTFPESTTFGLFLAMGFMALLTRRDAFKAKRYWVGSMAMALLGIYAANARSTLVALALGVLVYDLYRKRYQSLMVKGGLLGLVYAIALLVAQFSPSFAERIGVGGNSVGTAQYRELLVRRGTEEIKKHPLLGVSVSDAYEALSDLRQGEGIVDFVNAYIFYGMTLGIGGMIAFALTFVLTSTSMVRARRNLWHDVRLAEMGGAVCAIGITTMVTCYVTGFGGRTTIIFLLFAGLGSALSTVRRPKAPPATQPVEPAEQPRPRLRSARAAG